MKSYLLKKNYKIIDDSLFKSIIHTFHIIAEKEEQNISNKRKSDETFKIEYSKVSKKRDKKKRDKQESSEEEKEQYKPNQQPFKNDSNDRKKLKNMIPGFSIIKNKIITPLLIASEKVVEYMIPENQGDSENENKVTKVTQDIIDPIGDDSDILQRKMEGLTLEENRKHRKATMKLLRRSYQNINISKNLIEKASDWVDFISERAPVKSKVTKNFVTDMVELSETAVQRISASCDNLYNTNEQVNMRFIKPSKKFYNLLMSVWVKMEYTTILSLTEDSFIESVKLESLKQSLEWVESYLKPTKAFFQIAKEEFINLYKLQKMDSLDINEEPRDFQLSMSRFFSTIKASLLELWNSEIIDKSFKFTQASVSKENENSEEEVGGEKTW